ncbi:MAG: MBL fold metallo-hydrolase [Acidobacteria bacterium]|nr:MBL fold metallo-hydrolase [Acidobacteriota bacterium]
MKPPKSVLTQALTLLAMVGLTLAVMAQAPEPDGAGVRPGVLPEKWLVGGPNCMEVPEFQVHEYNPDFYILRQSGCSHYEKPFLYLLFGQDRALLLDTGAGMPDVKRVVMETVDKWCARNGKESIPLVVAHTHNHSDHVAGDKQFQGVPNVTFVGADVDTAVAYWGFKKWPEDVIEYDLGGRVLDIFGIPGHQRASIAVYDRESGVLITGDLIYPGRLYIDDAAAFEASLERMLKFTEGKIVTHLLGCHIEQTDTPYLEYPIGSIYQPNEHALDLNRGVLYELQEIVRNKKGELQRVALRDLTIYPVNAEVWGALRAKRKEVEERQRLTQFKQPGGAE